MWSCVECTCTMHSLRWRYPKTLETALVCHSMRISNTNWSRFRFNINFRRKGMENREHGGADPALMSLTFFDRLLQSHLPFGKTRCDRSISTAKCFPFEKLCNDILHLLWMLAMSIPFATIAVLPHEKTITSHQWYSVPRCSDVAHNVISMRDSQPCVEHCSEFRTNKLTWLALIGICLLHRCKCSCTTFVRPIMMIVNWNKRRENTNCKTQKLQAFVCDF